MEQEEEEERNKKQRVDKHSDSFGTSSCLFFCTMLAFLCCPFLFPLSLPVLLSTHRHANTHIRSVATKRGSVPSVATDHPAVPHSSKGWTSRVLILYHPSRGPSRRTKRRPPRRYS